jgi:PAS domain S-box-containing protein
MEEQANNLSYADLREQAQMRLQRGQRPDLEEVDLESLSAEDARRLLHELQVHQLELEIQNEELRSAHAELKRSHDRYANLYDFAPVGYLTLDEEGIVHGLNLTLSALLDEGRESLVGERFARAVATSSQVTYLEFRRRLFRSPDPQRVELQLRRGGFLFDAELKGVRLSPSKDGGARLARIAISDITERMQAERELARYRTHLEDLIQERTNELGGAYASLREGEQRLRLAVDAAGLATWEWRVATGHVTWGGHTNLIAPSTQGEMLDDFLARVHDEDRPELKRALHRAAEASAALDVEFRLPRGDEAPRWYALQAAAYSGPGETRLIGVLRDVTTRREADRRRADLLERERAARAAAEEAARLKTTFLAMVSHELRSPLTSILGYADTLLARDVEWDAASQEQFVATIHEEAERLESMVDQLLEAARLQSGAMPVEARPAALGDIVADAEAQLHAITPQHTLQIAIPDGLPPVMADATRVSQVLVNLVENAAKYSPTNSTITLLAREMEGFVQVEVVDEGDGIDPEDREVIFEAFRRARGDVGNGGAGLGLAICKAIVEAHGGEIWVKDAPMPGATICFTLPVAPGEADAPETT